MPGGVHFSSGNYGTGPNYLLFLTGVSIMALGAIAITLAYVIIWLVGYFSGLPLSDTWQGLVHSGNLPDTVLVQTGLNLVVFLCFLVVLRLSPLAGYHGAEHKVVHCLELYGVVDRDLAKTCPRAHKRCGTTLLAGFLPIPFLAIPLLSIPFYGVPAALAIAAVGWLTRFPVGALIQQIFTTKEPTPHQMDTAVRAAERLLERWRRDPHRRVPLWQGLWVRGFPQMVAGAIIAAQVLNWLQVKLPFWLDFGHVLH